MGNIYKGRCFKMIEFVSKKEYTPFREEIETIIKKVQKLLKKDDKDLTFQFRLIGSGSRHLITRKKSGNAGYDFDYNLIINQNFKWKPKVREDFLNAFQMATKGTCFNKIKNSTSVITIKYVKGDKVVVRSDFSIIYYPDDEECDYYKYIRFNKNRQNYTWEIRNVSRFSNEKFERLLEFYPQIWNKIREEYLKLKNTNKDENKHSFILYHEAINNIHNIFFRKRIKGYRWVLNQNIFYEKVPIFEYIPTVSIWQVM